MNTQIKDEDRQQIIEKLHSLEGFEESEFIDNLTFSKITDDENFTRIVKFVLTNNNYFYVDVRQFFNTVEGSLVIINESERLTSL